MTVRRRRVTGSCLALLCVLAWACVLPPSANGNPSPEPQPPPTVVHFIATWGPIVYLRNETLHDNLTYATGGLTGSSAIVFQDFAVNKSYWAFLDGGTLYVKASPSLPEQTTTDVPGRFITSQKPYLIFPAKESDKRDLSHLLIDVYHYSTLDPEVPTIVHTPFLSGKGWTDGKGATYAEAKAILESLQVNISPSTPQAGYVQGQLPSAGVLVNPGATVTLTFEGDPVPDPSTKGDTPDDAFVVDDPGDIEGPMTPQHTSVLGSSPATPRSDLFFKLGSNARNKVLTVTQDSGYFDALSLSVWRRKSGTTNPLQFVPPDPENDQVTESKGNTPSLGFLVPADGNDYFVVAEFQYRSVGDVRLKIAW